MKEQVFLLLFLTGCYKSDGLLFAILQMNNDGTFPKGTQIRKYIYSEAGAGKSRCDQVNKHIFYFFERLREFSKLIRKGWMGGPSCLVFQNSL